MPRRKRYYDGPAYTGPKRFSGNPFAVRKVARQEAKKVYDARSELKDVVVGSGGHVSVSTTPTYTQLSAVAEGDDADERSGSEIVCKGVNIRYECLGQDSTNLMRVLVFTWKDGTNDPAMNDILAATGTYSAISYINRENDVGFKILYDRLHRLVVGTSAESAISHINLRFKNGIKMYYDGAATTSKGRRQLWLMVISDSGAVNHPTINWCGRFFFQDG